MVSKIWLILLQVALAMGMSPCGLAQTPANPSGLSQGSALSQVSSQGLEFNRDVRPILSEHCFACHGPDGKKREADLRLDTQAGLRGSGERAGAVIAGDPKNSPMMHRIVADDDTIMPPVEFGKPLSESQKEILEKWIAQGATFQGHWSFESIPETFPWAEGSPSLSNQGAQTIGDHPIDRSIEAAQALHQLQPAPIADRVTLIRRLSFDLRGLPPTPEEVDAFVADTRPNAFELCVETFLASPHFGERMAMQWLDLVRYADSVGYHGDQATSVSPFRDYVIQSFNDNLPFDQFTREQLAGDLLAKELLEQSSNADDLELERRVERLQIAAGYNRLGMMSAEGGVQDKEYLAKYMAERVRNVGGTWLGVTMGCCECHDHKYDPFTKEDFYSLAAFFADIEEKGLYSGANDTGVWGPSIRVPSETQRLERRRLDQRLAELRAQWEADSESVDQEQIKWEADFQQWKTLRPVEMIASESTTLAMLEDGSILASGPVPDRDRYSLLFAEMPSDWRSLRIEVLPDPSLPKQGPGRAGNGNFVLSEVRLLVVDSETRQETEVEGAWESAVASYEQTGAADGNPYQRWSIEGAIDGDRKGAKWGWAIMEKAGTPQHAILHRREMAGSEPNSSAGQGATKAWRLVLEQNLDSPRHTLGRFRISVSTQAKADAVREVDAGLWSALNLPASARSESQQQAIRQYFRKVAPSFAGLRQELDAVEQERKQLESGMTSMLVTRTVPPRTVRVLPRGNWMDETGAIVQPATPQVLSPAGGARKDRLDLANWLVDPRNPLTARVFVNRLWKQLMGTGLSRRVDDFGSQGDMPSHPELLDWLARRFLESQWDVKAMVRLIVSSKAYQRASQVDEQQWNADPTNRWYARQNRMRLDAELIRDNALAVSGLLVPTIGGKSVKPYQPPGYWMYLNFPQREWQNGTGEELYRRGLYTHWQRQYLHPSLLAFDAPCREECTPDRPRSNTPLQSLALLNDVTYLEAARALAQRVMEQSEGAENRLRQMWRLVLSREVTPEEAEAVLQVVARHQVQGSQDRNQVDRLLANGQSPVPTGMDRVELAAWISAARVVLNLHETIVRP